jgi:hypothetical protein
MGAGATGVGAGFGIVVTTAVGAFLGFSPLAITGVATLRAIGVSAIALFIVIYLMKFYVQIVMIVQGCSFVLKPVIDLVQSSEYLDDNPSISILMLGN